MGHIPVHLKVIRIVLWVMSVPGILVTIFSGVMVGSLLWNELFPDPTDIGHGMAMLGFIPFLVYSVVGMAYLALLRFVWIAFKKRYIEEERRDRL